MEQEHLAIASVPMQKWESVFSAEEALRTGTIFPALDKPFFAAVKPTMPGTNSARSLQDAPVKTPVLEHAARCGCTDERESLMLKIQEISFVLDDVRLFMDTHPDNGDGLELLKSAVRTRKELLKEFALKFYPLTMDCMADIYTEHPESLCYCWQEGPTPWEGACV